MLANKQENISGRFWQGRFRTVRLCDETALLACAAYVDLNPIRAALAETLETSNFTSVQRRIQSLHFDQLNDPDVVLRDQSVEKLDQFQNDRQSKMPRPSVRPDRFLSPITIDELRDALGSNPSQSPYRASDKGFLSMSSRQYLQLLDWTARQVVRGKPGVTPADTPEVLNRLGIESDDWCTMVRDFGRLFYLVAGTPRTLAGERSRISKRPFHIPRRIGVSLTSTS